MPPLGLSGHESLSLCGLQFSPVVTRQDVLFSSPTYASELDLKFGWSQEPKMTDLNNDCWFN